MLGTAEKPGTCAPSVCCMCMLCELVRTFGSRTKQGAWLESPWLRSVSELSEKNLCLAFRRVSRKGLVQVAKKVYRLRMHAHGQDLYGPWRDTHAKAEADLARVRACDDKEGLLRQLVVGAGGEGARKGGRSTAGAPRLLPVPLYPDVC